MSRPSPFLVDILFPEEPTMNTTEPTMNAFDLLDAACAAYAADPTPANMTAVLVADDAAHLEAGLEVML